MCPVNRKSVNWFANGIRVMAANQGTTETENLGNSGSDNLILENQALKDKVRAVEMQVDVMRIQMTEIMGTLQALKNRTITEAAAVVNPGGTATILPTSGPAETVTAIPHPGPGVNHPARTLGGTDPYEVVHFNDVGDYPQGHQIENSQLKDQLHELEKRLKAIESSKSRAKEARDLCLVPDLVIPPKMKVPEFDKYCGTSCPEGHITMYARRMTAHNHDDKLLIHYFQYSLTGAPQAWYMQLQPSDIHSWKDLHEAFVKQYEYNIGIAPDRIQLQHMSKKDGESFREYAQRWRNTAAQVKPPLTEKEMVSIFVETLPAIFYERLVGKVFTSFSDMVTVGEILEDGMKKGKISCNPASTDNASDFSTKKGGETNAIMGRRRSSKFSPIPMSYADLCGHLVSHNVISLREMKPVQPPFPRGYDSNARCDFHSGAIGHSTKNCKPFKYLVQGLIDTKQLAFDEDGGIIVSLNPPFSGIDEWK